MLTEEEKIAKAKTIAHNVLLQIGNDDIMNRVIRNYLYRHMLANHDNKI